MTDSINVPLVAIAIDDNYAQHACVMLQSLKINNQRNIIVYCIYADLSSKNRKLIEKHFKNSNLKLTFLKFSKESAPRLPIKLNDHVTIATFFRIWLPDILPDVDEILFLDSDIVINGDISYLLDLSLNHYPLGAIEDPGMDDKKKEVLNIPVNKKYLNAGVLKMNLKYFRDKNLTAQMLKFIVDHPEKCEFWDQDAINSVIRGDFYDIDFKYNFQAGIYEARFKHDNRFKEAIANPKIIHFTGGGDCKPWYFANSHPLKRLYYKYLTRTPFRNYFPPDLPPASSITKFIRIFSRYYKVI